MLQDNFIITQCYWGQFLYNAKILDDSMCMKKKDLVICKNLGKLRLSVVQLMHHIL